MNDKAIKELVATLAQTPVEVTYLLEHLPTESIAIRPSPDEFSVLENVCHLRDIEIAGYRVRIQRILDEDQPMLSDIDGARLAIERDYNRQSLNEAMEAFTSARRQNVAVLTETAADDFEREGDMEGLGRITLRKLLEMMCEHDEGHIDDLRVIRARILRAAEA
ncbi:MAG TPA: DinB family protein [Pyrinomonadaceae bacterium]|jgi:hypothetical protein|nr:DinB family protein [Pyrinomonadaceae bacterium]